MKKAKFLAVLMTVVLLFSVCAAGSSALLQGLLGTSNAQETDIDIAGLLEGLEIDPNNIAGALGGLFGSTEDSSDVNDDQLDTITTIVQALLGGTQEGESTLDAIKDKLGDLGGTVSENELIQAIISTLMGFDFSNFDFSMLTSNDFISALMNTLGGININGAQNATPSTQAPTQSVIITTAPTLVNGGNTPTLNNQIPTSNIPTGNIPVISTQPQQNTPTNPTAYSGSQGVIVDNTTTPTIYNAENNTVPTVPGASNPPQTNTPDGSKSMVSGKMIVGVIVLLLSAISVVAVVLVLKKNRP